MQLSWPACLPPPLKVDFVECEKQSGFEAVVGAVHMASAASSRWSTWVELGACTNACFISLWDNGR